MALTKVIGNGVQGISNSSDATAMTIGSDEVVDFASNADFIDGRGIRLGNGNDFQLYHDGTDNHINVTGSQTLNIQTSGNNAIVVDANGHVTKPLQPSCHVQLSSAMANLSASTTKVTFDSEVFDVNGDFNTTDNQFIAPVTGKYLVNFSLYLYSSIDAAANFYEAYINTSNRDYFPATFDPDFGGTGHDLNYFNAQGSAVCDLDAGDSAKIQFVQTVGSAQTDLATASFLNITLIC